MASTVVASSAKALKNGPSTLSKVLETLNQQPRLQLSGVSSIKIRWNSKNDSFGARYFVKDALPRIRWANPSLAIEVNKAIKKEEHTKQEIEVKLASGKSATIEMDKKWSTAIIRELMDVAGGDPWRTYKKARQAEGLPIIPGEEKESQLRKPTPSFKTSRAKPKSKSKAKAKLSS